MTDLRKAAEMALEALDIACRKYGDVGGALTDWGRWDAAMTALRQALAQPEQEPVGYVTIETISSWAKVPSIKWFKKPTEGPLYTAPPKREWVGLTRDEIDYCFEQCVIRKFNEDGTEESIVSIYKVVEAIEAELKEKNT